jgi:hypothetical protein
MPFFGRVIIGGWQDETILFPLVGFKNTLPYWRHATSPPIVNWPEYIRSHGATPLGGNYPADV